jgi:hypothetical protein
MSNKRITKTFLKRLGGLILIIAAICLILGYCIRASAHGRLHRAVCQHG